MVSMGTVVINRKKKDPKKQTNNERKYTDIKKYHKKLHQ